MTLDILILNSLKTIQHQSLAFIRLKLSYLAENLGITFLDWHYSKCE